ncbi:insulin-like growth factor-binding protein 6 [Paramormyrops kingsleyae]|uniref:Insulin-like growth factor-binding protein 3 n=1 Tax=Paramormyrops kingsleyae TaxID=1676925 RepID=A0A3B3RUA8_9TELE|nr:insulin-like growth factor-binding protein 3 [Paramormyrops kingsleyae]
MVHLSDLLAFTLMLGAVSAVRSGIARTHLLKAGGKSEGPRDPVGDLSTTTLALGEPCGVYTLSCAKGLRCMPSAQETGPLQALLQGRGICTKGSRASPPERPHPTGGNPSNTGELEKAPCRKLLNTLLQHLELTVFPSNSDIYIPNCNTRGYYRKKQCRSSMGMQRGQCWCVDEHGTLLPTRASNDGTISCDGQ